MASNKIKGMVALKDVFFDEELYPRTSYNWQTSYDYSQSMKTGATFPPIILAIYKRKKYLVDGKHRLEAHKICKLDKIEAIVYTGWTRKKIFEESIRLNIAHGRVLSPYEKRKIALKLKSWKYGAAQISDLIQVPQGNLQKFIGTRLINAITGDVEYESIVKSGVKHLAGGTYSENQIKNIEATQKDWYMHNQVDLLDQVIDLFSNKLINIKDKKVKVRVTELKKLLKKY